MAWHSIALATAASCGESSFENIWIQPAAGDAGGALGVALALWYHHLGHERVADGENDAMRAALLGPEYGDDEIYHCIEKQAGVVQKFAEDELPVRVAELLAAGKGRRIFPGADGIWATCARCPVDSRRDPRSIQMQSVMNRKIKFRESFRPFGPDNPARVRTRVL